MGSEGWWGGGYWKGVPINRRIQRPRCKTRAQTPGGTYDGTVNMTGPPTGRFNMERKWKPKPLKMLVTGGSYHY